jgi:hypothetical protein
MFSEQKLTVSFCGLGPEAASAVAQVLAFPECALGHLDIMVRENTCML